MTLEQVLSWLVPPLFGLIPAVFMANYHKRIKKEDEERNALIEKIDASQVSVDEKISKLSVIIKRGKDEQLKEVEKLATKLELIKEELIGLKESVIKLSVESQGVARFVEESRKVFGEVRVLDTTTRKLETDITRIFQHLGKG